MQRCARPCKKRTPAAACSCRASRWGAVRAAVPARCRRARADLAPWPRAARPAWLPPVARLLLPCADLTPGNVLLKTVGNNNGVVVKLAVRSARACLVLLILMLFPC